MNTLNLPFREYAKLLLCPNCRETSGSLVESGNYIVCSSCKKRYLIIDSVPILLTKINRYSKKLIQKREISGNKKEVTQLLNFGSIVRKGLGFLKKLVIYSLSQFKQLYYIVYCYLQLIRYPRFYAQKESKERFFNFYYPRCLWRDLPGHLILKLFEGYCYQKTEITPPSLEIGPGAGDTSSINFAGRKLTFGLEYFGDNIDKRTLELFETVICGGINPIPFRKETMATILAVHIIDHLLDIDAALKEVSRVLRPGGRFVFTANGYKYPFLEHYPFRPKSSEAIKKWELRMLKGTRPNGYPLFKCDDPEDAVGQNCYTKDKWDGIAKKHGLKVTKYKEYICGSNAGLFTLLWYHSIMTKTSFRILRQFYLRIIKGMFLADESLSDQGGLEVYIEMEKR